jgi:hypothetical protein
VRVLSPGRSFLPAIRIILIILLSPLESRGVLVSVLLSTPSLMILLLSGIREGRFVLLSEMISCQEAQLFLSVDPRGLVSMGHCLGYSYLRWLSGIKQLLAKEAKH